MATNGMSMPEVGADARHADPLHHTHAVQTPPWPRGEDATWRVRAGIGVVLVLLAGVYLWVALGVRPPRGFSGDEPHYLAITQGLWLYHTIDQHRVLYHHDFLAYYPRLMSSHSVHRGQRLYPLHYLGFPVFLLPGFALGGARGAQVLTALVAVLVCWRSWRLCRRVARPIAALVTIGVLGLSAPFVLNAGAIYPDLLSALLLLLVFEAVDAVRLSARRALALGLLLAYAPWLHVKLLVVVAIVMLWAVITLWRQMRGRGEREPATLPALLALGLPLLSVIGLMLFNRAFYGSFSPTAPYQGPTLLTGNPLGGLMGQLLAQGQGALGTAPFALLALPGAVALWRRDRALALKIGVVTLPFWLITLSYRDWWGGDAPPLRYLLPFLPLWAAGIAALLSALRGLAARLAVASLAMVTLVLSLVIPLAPRLGWPLPGGQGALLLALGDQLRLPLTRWLPAFEPTYSGPGVWHHATLIPLWVAALLALWLVVAWRERSAAARVTKR